MRPPLFLYIHIPFCLQKCCYCDFTTWSCSSKISHKEYVNLIKKEILSRSIPLKNHEIQTIYFGGGTPSLLSAPLLENILQTIQKYFYVSQKPEITIEINPGTIFDKKLKEFLDLGINRFSVGVQTFDDSLLKLFKREHTSQDTRNTLNLLSKRGANFSCDLLFALPNQNLSHMSLDLKKILDFNPTHISAYCLTLPKDHWLQKNRPSEDEQIKMFGHMEETLNKNSYQQYEISNFCKKSFESVHNKSYWEDQEFLGLGVSSHSYLKKASFGVRFWNSKSLKKYQDQISRPAHPEVFSPLPQSQVEFLTLKEAIGDFCYTSLRTSQGLNLQKLEEKFGPKVLKRVLNSLNPYFKKGWVDQDNGKWILNFKGRMMSDQIFSSLFFLNPTFVDF